MCKLSEPKGADELRETLGRLRSQRTRLKQATPTEPERIELITDSIMKTRVRLARLRLPLLQQRVEAAESHLSALFARAPGDERLIVVAEEHLHSLENELYECERFLEENE